MRGLKQGIIGAAFVGGAVLPGGAWALASFDTSAQVIVAVGQSMGQYDGSFGPLAVDGPDGFLDAGDIFNNTGSAAEIGADNFGGPTLSGIGTIGTSHRDGVPGVSDATPVVSWNFNPTAVPGTYSNWATEGTKTLATGQKVQLSGSASQGGSLDIGLLNNKAGTGQTHQISFEVVNESSTEDLVLDFVAIPNLLVNVFSDKLGDNVSVEAAVNLGFIGMETGDVTYIMERGQPDFYTAEKQVFGNITAVSFARNASIIDGVLDEGMRTGQQPVPLFAWVEGRVAPNSTGTFLIEFVAQAQIETMREQSPVPVPAALPLLAGALAGLGLMARRRSRAG
jgi:hypothetical protein